MADRLAAIGGELEIVSVPGEGTTVRGDVPAQPRSEATSNALASYA